MTKGEMNQSNCKIPLLLYCEELISTSPSAQESIDCARVAMSYGRLELLKSW